MANHAALIRADNAGLNVHRRGRRFIEFDLGGGRYRHVATIDPLHKRDSETEIDATWYPDTGAWQWRIGENDWQAHARSVFNVGSLIEWRHASGEWVVVDPQSINWVNQDYSRQQIAIKQAVTGVANDATLSYPNAYGPGRHFEYIAHPRRLIKHFIIDSLANLPAPTVTGTIWLEVEWTITNSSGVELYLDGVRWARRNKVKTQTSNRIEFRNVNTGEVLWYADAPHAADSGEGSVGAQYEVEATGGVYFIRVRVPREWLLSAVYPVKVDPTFTDGPSGDATTSFDGGTRKNNADGNYASITEIWNGNLTASDAGVGLYKFTLSTLVGSSIQSATLYFYDGAGTSYASTYKIKRLLSGNSGWNEACTWNYAQPSSVRWAGDSGSDGGNDAGCTVSGTDFSATEMGSMALASPGVGTERVFTLDVTEFGNMVSDNYGLLCYCTGTWERWQLCSSDNATTGYRPKLVVEYSTGGSPYSLPVDAGSYAITGQAPTLAAARKLAPDAGSYALTGQAAGITAQRAITLEAGGYAITGHDVTLTVARKLPLDAGSYGVTGEDAALKADRKLSLDAGSYAITGPDVTLTYTPVGAYVLECEAGVYSIAGQAPAITISRAMACEAGAYSMSGQAAGLVVDRSLALDAGDYALSGLDSTLEIARLLSFDAGSYTIAGQDPTLTYEALSMPGSVDISDAVVGDVSIVDAAVGSLSISDAAVGSVVIADA